MPVRDVLAFRVGCGVGGEGRLKSQRNAIHVKRKKSSLAFFAGAGNQEFLRIQHLVD